MMPTGELERLAEKVENLVEDLKRARTEGHNLVAEKRRLEENLAHLDKQLRQSQKEGDQSEELVAQNKAYKKKQALLKSKVVSMLAKVEALQ